MVDVADEIFGMSWGKLSGSSEGMGSPNMRKIPAGRLLLFDRPSI